VRCADGKERVIPVHGLRQLDIFSVLDDLGVRSFRELTNPEDQLQAFRVAVRILAAGLSFPDQGDVWDAARVQATFADANEILKAFNRCVELSDLPKPPGTGKPSIQHGPYG